MQEPAKRETAEKSFPVVALGASAGGLEALEAFMAHTPFETGMAFVIIQHLSANHKSLMPEILQRATPMKVIQIEDGMRIEPNRVYLNPPEKEVTLFNSTFQLIDPAPGEGLRLPIDYFFRSLAENVGEKAICVILSGTGSDGSLGLRAIKEKGGMAMAQEKNQAKYAGMPESAIETGLVDLILPVEKMPEELSRYVQHPYMRTRPESNLLEETEAGAFNKIIMLLRARAGVDFTHYKEPTILRRIQRRMALHQLEQMIAYFRLLQDRQNEAQLLFKDLLIGVTSFFRDPQAFTVLETKIIPLLLEQKQVNSPLRIWVPGCSTGEEAVSIALLLAEAHKMDMPLDVQIFATDVDPEAVEYARAGKYPESIAADVPEQLLQRYFQKEDKEYKVFKKIREMIVYAVQNLVLDPPFSRIDLISCRNLLIYLDTTLQQKVFSTFHYSLRQDGYLFVGSSEGTGTFSNLFSPLDARWKIYRRKGAVQKIVSAPFQPFLQVGATIPDLRRERKEAVKEVAIREVAEKRLIAQYVPACVFVDENYNTLYFHGATHKYLVQPGGEMTSNVLKMARRELQAKLTVAIDKAFRQKTTVVCEGVQIARDYGGVISVDVIVQPVREPSLMQDLVMVAFEEKTYSNKAAGRDEDSTECPQTDSRILSLENDLHTTREYLQATIEELETTNEELRSTSEESQSANEELMSANEELETSREELVIMNSELQRKIMQLSDLSSDMENLLVSTAIGTVFLDSRLNIRRFTPAMTAVFNLIPSDVGRPISDITSKFANYDLSASARDVLKTLQQREAEVQSKEGAWFSIRMLPYRTVDNMIDGIVVSFVDVTGVKKAEKIANDARAFAENIIDTIREALLVLDEDLKVISANKVFYRIFETTCEKIDGEHFFSLCEDHWNIPRLRELLEQIIPESSSFNDFVLEHDFPHIGHRKMVLNARMMKRESGNPDLILLAIEDITDRADCGR